MKKLIFILMMVLGVFGFSQKYKECSQNGEKKEMLDREREVSFFSERYKKNSPEERKKFFRQMQTQSIIQVLKLSGEKQKELKKLLEEYFSKSDEIVKKFKVNFRKKKRGIEEEILTNEEALVQLKSRLEIAQELLDMRKEYMDKFLQVLTPQQILRMNQLEKEMTEYFRKYEEKKKK